MVQSTPKPEPVSPAPEVKVEKTAPEEMVDVMVDREMTDGGITINGKRYVGKVKVTAGMADDLMRIQEEYFETKKKMFDPSVSVRMKNDLQKEALFLADPKVNAGKKNYTQMYGLLPIQEWNYCSPTFKAHLIEQRQALYGY